MSYHLVTVDITDSNDTFITQFKLKLKLKTSDIEDQVDDTLWLPEDHYFTIVATEELEI